MKLRAPERGVHRERHLRQGQGSAGRQRREGKDLLGDNAEKVDDVVDKIAATVDDKTGHKHKDKITEGAAKAKDAIAKFVDDDDPAPSRRRCGPP